MDQRAHKIVAALLSIAFLIVVQIFSSPTPIFRFLVPAFFTYLVLVGAYDYWYLQKIGKYNFWLWFRVVLFLTAWFALFFLIPNQFLQGTFLLLSLVLMYSIQAFLGKTGQQVLSSLTLLTAFAFCMSLTAFSAYFPLSSVLYFSLLAIFVGLLARAAFDLTPANNRTKVLGAITVALLITELYWVLTFLPFHYSVIGLILFNFFYFIWSLYYYFLFKLLTRKRVELQLGLLVIFTGIILLATRFVPLTT